MYCRSLCCLPGTIAENIAFGVDDADDGAAAMARAEAAVAEAVTTD